MRIPIRVTAAAAVAVAAVATAASPAFASASSPASAGPTDHAVFVQTVAEAGPNALATFDLSRSGTVSLLSQAGTGQAATCWVTPAGSFLSPLTRAHPPKAASPRRLAGS